MLYHSHFLIKIKINCHTNKIHSNNYSLHNHNMLLQGQTINLLLSFTRILLINLSSFQILLSNLLMVSNTIQCNYNNYNSKCSTSNTTTNKCSCRTKLLSLKKFSRMELSFLLTPHMMTVTTRKVSVEVAGEKLTPL